MINEYSSYLMTEDCVTYARYTVNSGELYWRVTTADGSVERSICTKKPLWIMKDKDISNLSKMTGWAVDFDMIASLQAMMDGNPLIQVNRVSTRTIKYEADTGVEMSGFFSWLYVKIGTIFMRLTFQTPPDIQRGTKFTIHFYKGRQLYFKELILHSTRRKTIQEYREHILDSYDWMLVK